MRHHRARTLNAIGILAHTKKVARRGALLAGSSFSPSAQPR